MTVQMPLCVLPCEMDLVSEPHAYTKFSWKLTEIHRPFLLTEHDRQTTP